MRRRLGTYARGQGGYTLVEVIIASAIGAVVLAGLTSVILTSYRAANIATSRVEASGQIRNFEFFAYDDFARSGMPGVPGTCGLPPNPPCQTQPLVLPGFQASNSATPVVQPLQVTYAWDGVQFLDRQVGSSSLHAATDVSAFSWYLDPTNQDVVVTLTITVQAFTEYQTFRFQPRLNP